LARIPALCNASGVIPRQLSFHYVNSHRYSPSPVVISGFGSFTLVVSNMEEQIAQLQKPQIDTSQRTAREKVKTLMITDPDGNHIAFAEPIDPGLAR